MSAIGALSGASFDSLGCDPCRSAPTGLNGIYRLMRAGQDFTGTYTPHASIWIC